MQFTITWSVFKDIALFAIALWGALLSTFNWYQCSQRNKRKVRVTHGYKYVLWHGGDIGPAYLEIKATNVGNRPVTIATLTLLTPNGKWVANQASVTGMEDTARPATLADGEVAVAHFFLRGIRSGLFYPGIDQKVYVTPFAVDTLGKTYKGKPIEIDMSATD